MTAPKAGATNAPTSTQDQIYSVQAQGNTAKLGQPLPVWYGRLKTFPDFAATPWGEFVANDQYENILLSIGMGSFEYENLYIDDTILWDPINGVSSTFTGAQVAFYEPGATVTLFPTNVDASVEVTGQQLPDGTGTLGGQFVDATAVTPGAVVGAFVANPSGTLAQSIAVDFVYPSGSFTVDTKNQNSYGYAWVNLIAEYCPVDGAGAPTGPFTTLFNVTRGYCSLSPVRDSVKVDVTPGRYAVRLHRTDAGIPSTQGSNAVIWAGLRSFLQGANSFADVSTVAIRILATQSTQGSYKFGVLATRKLPVWNGSAFVTQSTRNPGWAFLDAVTNSQYGSQLSISKVDFNSVVNFATGCDTRGDCFDYEFTTAVAVPAAFDKILTAARARHFWLGDTVSIARDEWSDVPSMLLTDREIVRDSTQVTWTMLGDEDPDAVVVEYVDENTWGPAQVQYPPDTDLFTSVNAVVQRIDGIIQRDQAFREAAFYYLQSIYRRENVQIGVEYEGRAIQFGSRIRLQSELPMAYGYGGAVVSVATHALTLDPAPVWDAGPFYIRLRMPNGNWFGPVTATMGADPTIANLDATSLSAAEAAQSTTLADVLARDDGAEYPSFELGTADSQSKVCVVLSGVPNGELCTLTMVVDDERVHATDLGDPPILPVAQFPANASLPLIVGLNGSFTQGVAEPMLSASWFPANGAVYYIAQVSFDAGNSWQQIYEGQDNKFSSVTTLAAVTLRVQGVTANLKGPYTSISIEAPTIVITSDTVALSSLIDGIKFQVSTLLNQFNDKISGLEAQIAAVASNANARQWNNKQMTQTQLMSVTGTLSASITEVMTVATDTTTAFAAFETTVTAALDGQTVTITENTTAIADINTGLVASWSLTLDVNGHISGLKQLSDGTTAFFIIDTDVFQIANPSAFGGAAQTVFTLQTVGGVTQMALRGDFIADGTITTRALAAGSVDAITLAANSVTATAIQAGSINTAALAVNSVSLANIIAGSVTNETFATHSTFATVPVSSTIVSVTATIESGNATVEWDCSQINATDGSSTVCHIVFSLFVDGVSVRSWTWSGYISTGNQLNTPISVADYVTGLSSASHTFTIKCTSSTFSTCALDGGFIRVQDLRR